MGIPAPQKEKDMKMDINLGKKPFRVTPLFFRRIHKWVGLILGLQFVLWTVSGTVMALLDKDEVGGHSASEMTSATTPWPTGITPPLLNGRVEGLVLRRILDRPVYEVNGSQGRRLIDARNGRSIRIDATLASKIAKAAYGHAAPVRSVTRLETANLEARDHDGPMWRVDFADKRNSSSYVSAGTGRPLVDRSDTWRTWDFVWMLHNMDYVNRKSFNHPLIIFVAFGTLWMSFTGFYLLFKSFRRREFRWVLGPFRR